MTRVLVTGGTGVLGRALRPRLLADGYTVRVMSRRAPAPGEDTDIEWAQADLAQDTEVADAVAGANVIVHLISSLTSREVDVDGTARLLEHARAHGVDHFIYISIVGVDRIQFSYYQNKLAAERLVEASEVPWSIQRATQFHPFIDRILGALTRLPVAFVPTDWHFQSISTGDVADRLAAVVAQGPAGRLPDLGGPEVLRFDEMARQWLAAQGRRRPIVHLPVPGKLSAGFRQGLNTTPQNAVGTTTWADWLAAHYAGNMVTQP